MFICKNIFIIFALSKVIKNYWMVIGSNMKNIIITVILLWMSIGLCQAQTLQNYAVKTDFIYGNILKHTKHLDNLVENPVAGAELAVEWQTMGEKPWHQYFGFPTIGVGLVGLDLGNPEMLGQLLAVYPYLNIKLLDLKFLKINIQGGAGASFLNKRYSNTPHLANTLNGINNEPNQANAAIGSILNVYFAGGGNVEVPLGSGFTAIAGYTWNHASNGSFYQPNSGINMLNASVGLKYCPVYKSNYQPVRKEIPSMPQNFAVEVIASGGARELYYKDDKMYPTGSLVLAAYRQVGNNIRLGLGVDGFYDGVYDGTTKFRRTYLTTDELKNKIRVGVSFQPELVFGKLTAGIHLGMYLYNPLKNLEPYADAQNNLLNKPLIYTYNIEDEDGWFYSRASLKYTFTNHIFASLGLKTHLQKAEFIEWGLGYRF